jgi:hypothetical protein
MVSYKKNRKEGRTGMAKRKYEKHFLTSPLIKGDDVRYRITCQGSKTGFGGLMKNYWLRWNCITKPRSMGDPHTHDFDEIFHFFGADASDISDFQAVVDFHMGEEGEIYTFDKPTIVYVPAGLKHAPINIKVVKKPIIFMNVANAPSYVMNVDGQPFVPTDLRRKA